MAACPIIDFGAMSTTGDRADKPLETNPQQVQYEAATRQITEPGERFRGAQELVELVEIAEQRGLLPIRAALVESQIESLPKSEDIEVRPTSYAHREAKRLIVGAYMTIFSGRLRAHKLPQPIIGTDDTGGILVSWTSGNKYVAAKFAYQPGSRSFVYREQGAQHQALDLNEQNLLSQLQWL